MGQKYVADGNVRTAESPNANPIVVKPRARTARVPSKLPATGGVVPTVLPALFATT